MEKNQRLTYILINVLAFVMLATVITSQFFKFPNYDSTGQTTMIVMAMSLVAISSVYAGSQNKTGQK